MSEHASGRDLADVEKVVWTYLDGLHEGDTQKLASAFHEVSHLYALGPDGVMDVPRADWLKMVSGRPSPKSQALERTDRIVSVDFWAQKPPASKSSARSRRAISPTI